MFPFVQSSPFFVCFSLFFHHAASCSLFIFLLLSTADSLKAIFYAKCKKRDYCKCLGKKRREEATDSDEAKLFIQFVTHYSLDCLLHTHTSFTITSERKMVNNFFAALFFPSSNLHFHFGYFRMNRRAGLRWKSGINHDVINHSFEWIPVFFVAGYLFFSEAKYWFNI